MLIKHQAIEKRIYAATPEEISDQISDRSATARLVEGIAFIGHVNETRVKAEILATSILLFRRLQTKLLNEDPDLLDLTVELLANGGDRRIFSRPSAHRKNARLHFAYKMEEGGTCRTTITKIYSPMTLRKRLSDDRSELKVCEES